MWFLKGLLSIGLLAGLLYLALLNSGQKVDVYVTGPGTPTANDVDLPIVLLASFVLGVLVWFFVSVFQVLSAKAEVATLKRKNRELLREISDLRNMTVRELDPDLLAEGGEDEGKKNADGDSAGKRRGVMSAADILLGGGVAIALVFLGLLFRNWSGQRRPPAPTLDTYALALSALINGDRREALRLFKETVQGDSTNVDAYIRLGDLLREGGETARALAIHRELMVRSTLPPSDRARILESLTRDYLAAGRHEEAGESAERLRSLDKRNRFAPAALQEVAEELGDWTRAIKVMEGRLREGGEKDKAQLARYRGYVGSRELAAGHRKEARQHFTEALKLDPDCLLARVSLGDLDRDDGELERAVNTWREMALRHPGDASLVFDRLERAAFELGQFGEMTSFYRELLHRTPREATVPALLALAEFHRRRGDLDEAESFIQEALEVEPEHMRAHRLLAKVALDRGDPEAGLARLDRVMRAVSEERGIGSCRSCGRTLDKPEWRCPHCRGLNPLGL